MLPVKKKYRLYNCGQYAVLEVNDRCRICGNLKQNKYYQINCEFDKLGLKDYSTLEYKLQVFDCLVYTLWMFIPYIICQIVKNVVGSEFDLSQIRNVDFVASILCLIFNIVVHELAHYLAMKCYKLPNARLGTKREGGRIKFYVDTTSTYLLPPYKRIVVYSVGILSNLYTIYLIVTISRLSNYSSLTVASLSLIFLVMSFLPFRGERNDLTNIMVLFIKKCNK